MNNPKSRKRLICLLLGLSFSFLSATSVSAATVSEIQEELDALAEQNNEIQAQIDALQQQYDESYGQMLTIVEQKSGIDQEISLLKTKIENTNIQISAYKQLIADAQEELEEANESLAVLRQEHRERVRAMEEGGTISYWQVLFQANSFTELLDRINMIQEISAADRKRMEALSVAADIVTATQLNLDAKKNALDEAVAQLESDERILAERSTQSDALLRQLAQQADEFQYLLLKSEAIQDELMKEIAAKEADLKQAQYNAYLVELAKSGQNPPSDAVWVTPVSGYTITSPFGMRVHPILGYEIMHNGIDMACSQGTPIYATRAGTVTTAAYQAGGAGYYVSINHLDGFSSIYMHMTHYVVSAGQSVSQGQLIGYVGSTGLSTGPHLHFGISYGGTYVNPLAYIA